MFKPKPEVLTYFFNVSVLGDFIDNYKLITIWKKPWVPVFVQVERAEPCERVEAPGPPGKQQ